MHGNLFAHLPADLPEEWAEPLAASASVRIERIVSLGHASPEGFWYDQDQDEFVVLLSGAARLHLDGEPSPRSLQPGDWLLIPAHQRHRVEWTKPEEPSIWLAVHLPSTSNLPHRPSCPTP